WGGSVFHCPFCHGWEVREQPLAVLAQGERAMHMARLLRGWSDDVIVLTNGTEDLTEETRDCLRASEVPVDERPIERLASVDGELEAIVFTDGSRLARRGLLVAATLHQRTDLATQLGLNFVEPGTVSMQAVEVDALYQTSAPGVFAAGDVCTQMPQVAAAVAAGSAAAASMVRSLMEEIDGI
ncbi:MAG: FAD-dependent oxidoreductase, partial [Mycobacterium sp.]